MKIKENQRKTKKTSDNQLNFNDKHKKDNETQWKSMKLYENQ